MKSARTTKGARSREKLLQAAAIAFAENGYHRTKVSDIVRAAGLTQAAFYLYFPSKEAIYTELIGHFRTRLRILADAGRNVTPLSPVDVPEQVRENVVALFRFLGAAPALTKIALYESADGEDVRRELAAMVLNNLRTNQAAGHIRSDISLEVAAESMVAVLDRLAARFLLTGEKTAEQLAEEAVPILLNGILRKEGEGVS